MKFFKSNIFIVLLLSISFVSCEKESSNSSITSIEEDTVEFQNLLRSSNTDEEPSDEPIVSDCSFDGVFSAKIGRSHFVGVNEFPFLFGSDAIVTWTIDNQIVNSVRPRFVRLNDHLSQPDIVEVCFSVTSSDCGTVGGCTTVSFEG